MDSKKMREYKYIKNTLPNNNASSSGENLGIGKQVVNLLPELSEENIRNGKGWKIDNPLLGSLKTSVKLDTNTTYSLQVINSSVTLTFIYTFKEKVSFPSEYREQYIFTSNDAIFYGLYYYRKESSEISSAYIEEIRFLKEPDKDSWITVYTREVNPKQGTEEFSWIDEKYRIIQSTSASAPSYFTKNLIEQEERKYPLFPIKFFNTGSITDFNYSIPGLTPYFNLENSRYWKSNIKPSVYLFKTDSAWLVDKDGVIFGQSSEPFVYLSDISNTALPIEYTDEKIAEIFTAPVIDINLSISISPDILSYKTNTNHSISLGVYRDALVNDRKVVWNKKEYYSRYGKLGHIGNGGAHKRKYVKTDNVKADVLKSKRFSANIQDYVVKEETSITIMLYPESTQKYWIDKKDDNIDQVPFNIALGSILSYNKNFAEQQGLSKEIKNKYTSVALKWIVKDGDGNIVYISPASNPILIDRSISEGWRYTKNDTSESWSFVPVDFTIKVKTYDENYHLLVSNPIFIVKE